MLDLDQLLCDAKNTDTLSHGTSFHPTGQAALSRTNPASMRVSGQFLSLGQTGHGFSGGASDAHFPPVETHHPRAPLGERKESRPEKQGHPLSHLSLINESEYPCGLQQDFTGTSGLSRPCPACPADKLEAMVERAAIMEYDGGLTRAAAEVAAGMACVMGSVDPIPKRYFPAMSREGSLEYAVALGCEPLAKATRGVTP
ncbi:MAG TPA: hypothetical protein VMV78_07845 [Thiobacillus sp.]|nr:hypothetical protein [Thiobacillus sp.]